MQYDKQTQEGMFKTIASWKQSGLSQKAYCEQHNIRYYVFHYWYKRYRDEHLSTREASFISVDVNPDSSSTLCANIEVVLPDGKRILFHQAVSSDFLRSVIS
jgi:hypothetical protein